MPSALYDDSYSFVSIPARFISFTYAGSVVAVRIGRTTSGFAFETFITDCGMGCVQTMFPWQGITSYTATFTPAFFSGSSSARWITSTWSGRSVETTATFLPFSALVTTRSPARRRSSPSADGPNDANRPLVDRYAESGAPPT